MGFAAIRKAKESADKSRAAFEGSRVREIKVMGDGDEAILYLIGEEPTEPKELFMHQLVFGKGRGGFPKETCSHGHEGFEGCVYCAEKKSGNKSVNARMKNYGCSAVDTRFVHKTPDPKASKKTGYEKFEWDECAKTDEDPDAKCVHCKAKKPRERRGLGKLILGLAAALALTNLNDSLKKRCKACGGKIAIDGYRKGKKRRDDVDDLDEEQRKEWEAIYSCSKCEEPDPGSIFGPPIRMRRNGQNQQTTYSFEKAEEGWKDPPKWVRKLEALDWDVVGSPRPLEKQAAQLDAENPFDDEGGGSKKSKPSRSRKDDDSDDYDDDDDEDDGKSPFGSDDDDDKPKSKKSKSKSKKSSKDDDDEDDSDDDDDDEDSDEEEDDDDEDEEEEEKPRKSSKTKSKKKSSREDDDDEDD